MLERRHHCEQAYVNRAVTILKPGRIALHRLCLPTHDFVRTTLQTVDVPRCLIVPMWAGPDAGKYMQPHLVATPRHLVPLPPQDPLPAHLLARPRAQIGNQTTSDGFDPSSLFGNSGFALRTAGALVGAGAFAAAYVFV